MKSLVEFTNLRERDLRSEGLFAAEGHLLIERAVNAGCALTAIFADASACGEARAFASPGTPVTVCAPGEMDRIAGFPFHRGMVAIVRRPDVPDFSPALLPARHTSRVLVLPAITDPGNLGTLLRSALAFGFDTILLGSASCDPFNRKALRSSMGAAFGLRLFRAVARSIRDLVSAGFTVYAAAMEKDALVSSGNGSDVTAPERLALVLGNEYEGIPEGWRESCTSAIRIPVAPDVDSLNVAVAGSILMREFSVFQHR